MKIKSLINYTLFFFILINSILKADAIFFDSKNIRIEDEGNMIFATKGKAKIPSDNLSFFSNMDLKLAQCKKLLSAHKPTLQGIA